MEVHYKETIRLGTEDHPNLKTDKDLQFTEFSYYKFRLEYKIFSEHVAIWFMSTWNYSIR